MKAGTDKERRSLVWSLRSTAGRGRVNHTCSVPKKGFFFFKTDQFRKRLRVAVILVSLSCPLSVLSDKNGSQYTQTDPFFPTLGRSDSHKCCCRFD